MRRAWYETKPVVATAENRAERYGPADPRSEPDDSVATSRYAWLLDDVKPTTERCPACVGRGYQEPRGCDLGGINVNALGENHLTCQTCRGAGHCDPIPAKGRQGLWSWT